MSDERRSRILVRTSLALLALLPVGAVAQHAWTCDEPREAWQPQMALQRQLEAAGWRVRRIVTTNGCYEVYGIDPARQRVEAFFNPRTLEPVGTDRGH